METIIVGRKYRTWSKFLKVMNWIALVGLFLSFAFILLSFSGIFLTTSGNFDGFIFMLVTAFSILTFFGFIPLIFINLLTMLYGIFKYKDYKMLYWLILPTLFGVVILLQRLNIIPSE